MLRQVQLAGMAMAPSFLFLHFLLPLPLLLALISLSHAQAYHNISLGSSLTPLGENRSWLSPSGEFAFGFYPLETNSSFFLLAIWFVKTANTTVVWYANGDQLVLVQDGARVELTTDQGLSLKDNNGQEVWNTGTSNATYAAMLDTGNFVLASADASVSWQSFAHPSDTILPSQELDLGTDLRSRMMDTDYSSGRFKLSVQSDGNLVFYPVAVPSGFQYDPYWTVGDGTKLVFDKLGTIYLALSNGTRFNFTSVRIASMDDFYHRATLDSYGVFRQYVYPKIGTQNGSWNEGWNPMDFQPPDICRALTTATGSGVCGFNSYCKYVGDHSLVDCECPLGYSLLDPNRKYKGCQANFPAQSCDADEKEIGSLYDLSLMINVDWPLSDYEHFNPLDEDKCRSECLSDCFCAVAVYNNGDCWKKKLPLSNGKTGDYVQRRTFIKVAKGNNSQPPPPTAVIVKKDRGAWILVGSLLLGSSAIVNFVLITVILFLSFCSYKKVRRKLQPRSNMAALSLRSFTYSELEEATNGFNEELGSGAFSRVYKGYLDDEPRTCVAVKKLDNLLPDMDKEFMNEVGSIGQTYHKNLVRLHGFCNEGTERLLVYEFMKNGSLTEFLFGSVRPNWNLRVKIALGIARGLMYLHEECSTQIIHCDIKPQNILLDDNLVARIADFGLAKLLRTDQTRTNTGIRGTRGYVAPEWFKSIGITAKVDVYSFGVMLLEIVCCRKNVEQEVGDEEALILTYWVNDCYRDGMLELVVEGDEEAALDMKRVERFVKVALWCIQEEPSMRPTMQKVTQMLDGATSIPEPPDPSSYISSIQ